MLKAEVVAILQNLGNSGCMEGLAIALNCSKLNSEFYSSYCAVVEPQRCMFKLQGIPVAAFSQVSHSL